MTALLFTLYTLLFCWLITRLPFFTRSGLNNQWLIALFLLKIAAGCFYGYVHTLSEYYPDKIDTWRFYFQSLPETELLKKDPAAFWHSLFANGYTDSGGILSHANSYWNDLKHNIMLLLMSVFNLFSRNNYYVNVLFYNFAAFAGLIAGYRVFTQAFPQKKTIVLVCFLLIPSVVFWGSGFHKEGLLLAAIGMILFQCSRLLVTRYRLPVIGYRLLLAGLGVGLIFLLRPYILFALLPALAAWFICVRTSWKPAVVFAVMYIVVVLVFFGSARTGASLPASISRVQQDFLQLGGHTTVTTDSLEPTAAGFLRYFPQAADLAFLRPRPGEGGITYLPSLFEAAGILLLFLLFLFFPNRTNQHRALLYFSLGFALVLLFITGYAVPVTGAIIRYKVIALPFLALFLAIQVDWPRLKSFILIK